MLYKDCIEELTGLKDLIIEKVQNVYGETHIYGHMAKRIQYQQDHVRSGK